MEKRKCIGIDLDGTLLNKKRKISPRSADAIRKLQNMGHVVVIATARHQTNVQELLDEVNLQCPIIGSSGATIHTHEGECISHFKLNKEQHIAPILEMLNENDMSYFLSQSNGGWLYRQSTTEEMRKDETREFKLIDGRIGEIESPILQVMAYTNAPEKKQELINVIQEQFPLSVASSNMQNIEIGPAEADKGQAMEVFANHINIPLQDCIAFGDSTNDKSIFAVVGRSFAMPHSPQELIEMATDRVRNGNDANGVAIELEKLARQWERQAKLENAKQ